MEFYEQLLESAQEFRKKVSKSIMKEGKIISDVNKIMLTSTFNVEDVKHALMDIDDIKTPRPDGYSSLFYKKSWDVIDDDIYNCCSVGFFQHWRIAEIDKLYYIVFDP